SPVGSYAIIPALADPDGKLGNYNVSSTNGTLTVSPRTVAVAADAKSKTYGDADPALTYHITSGSLVGTDAFNGRLPRDPGETVAGSPYAIKQGSLALSSNYALSFAGASLTITKAHLTVTAGNASRAYGSANPAFTYSVGGFVNGETLATSGVTGSPS